MTRTAAASKCMPMYNWRSLDVGYMLQVVLNNRQVYHMSKTTIDLDVNTYLTIDPKVRPCFMCL